MHSRSYDVRNGGSVGRARGGRPPPPYFVKKKKESQKSEKPARKAKKTGHTHPLPPSSRETKVSSVNDFGAMFLISLNIQKKIWLFAAFPYI